MPSVLIIDDNPSIAIDSRVLLSLHDISSMQAQFARRKVYSDLGHHQSRSSDTGYEFHQIQLLVKRVRTIQEDSRKSSRSSGYSPNRPDASDAAVDPH